MSQRRHLSGLEGRKEIFAGETVDAVGDELFADHPIPPSNGLTAASVKRFDEAGFILQE